MWRIYASSLGRKRTFRTKFGGSSRALSSQKCRRRELYAPCGRVTGARMTRQRAHSIFYASGSIFFMDRVALLSLRFVSEYSK